MKPLVPEDLRDLRRNQQSQHVRSLARAAIASAMCSLDRSLQNFERRWGDKDVELILRGAVPPASTASASALSPIVPSFLASLIPLSAGAALLQEGVVLRWDGAGAITLPTITGIVADWISESSPINIKAATTGPGPRLDPYKLAVLVTLSGETIRSSHAEEIVTDTLKKSRPGARRGLVLECRGHGWLAAARPAQWHRAIGGLDRDPEIGRDG
jgi:hypothetical protein